MYPALDLIPNGEDTEWPLSVSSPDFQIAAVICYLEVAVRKLNSIQIERERATESSMNNEFTANPVRITIQFPFRDIPDQIRAAVIHQPQQLNGNIGEIIHLNIIAPLLLLLVFYWPLVSN